MERSYRSIAETARHLGISEAVVRGRIKRGELEAETIDGRKFVKIDSSLIPAAQPSNSDIPSVQPSTIDPWSRRSFIAGIGAGVVSVACSDVAVKIWDYFQLDTIGKSPKDIGRLFSGWRNMQIVPGEIHPNFGFHPDIVDAQMGLLPLLEPKQVMQLRLEELPKPNPNAHLLLIGGPVSNQLSRCWRGFELNNGVLRSDGKLRSALRWEFMYPEVSKGQRFRRYVNGDVIESRQKYLADRDRPGKLGKESATKDPETGFLTHDWLLITHIPNIIKDSAAGNAIIDVADLHGQGDKAFSTILQNDQLRNDLYTATIKKGARYFQALYKVPVVHDNELKRTIAEIPELWDVFLIK
ncbi:MAG TPA: hypothetical protein PLL77_10015 [Pyrinomonadaceae bacterium]|nr:hypothetical protein [Pyrinomonadaceae bacterium]